MLIISSYLSDLPIKTESSVMLIGIIMTFDVNLDLSFED